MVCSMSDVGSCTDNVTYEGFFGLLKRERIYRKKYATRSEARADIFDYIERFYNPGKRLQLVMVEQERLPLTKLFVVRG